VCPSEIRTSMATPGVIGAISSRVDLKCARNVPVSMGSTRPSGCTVSSLLMN
jgi:hypothetical protein